MPDSALFTPLTLPNGAVLPNRLCKAAMEENLAAPGQVPGPDLFRLYKAWAQGGVGLVLTGNVMITPAAMTGPGGVVLEAGTDLAPSGNGRNLPGLPADTCGCRSTIPAVRRWTPWANRRWRRRRYVWTWASIPG